MRTAFTQRLQNRIENHRKQGKEQDKALLSVLSFFTTLKLMDVSSFRMKVARGLTLSTCTATYHLTKCLWKPLACAWTPCFTIIFRLKG